MFDLLHFLPILIGIFLIFPRRQNTRTMDRIINRRGPVIIGGRHGRRPLLPPFLNTAAEPQISTSSDHQTDYGPAPEDGIAVKNILMQTGNLPPEIADIIVDQAEYWACSSSSINYVNELGEALRVRGGVGSGENVFLLRTLPLALNGWSPSDENAWRRTARPRELQAEYPRERLLNLVEGPRPSLQHPCRKIVFDIYSHDQGHGGEYGNQGTYRGSYTWFDAGLERFDMKAGDAPDSPDQRDSTTDTPTSATHAGLEKIDKSAEGTSHSPGQKDSATDIPASHIRPIWPPIASEEVDPPRARYQHDLLPAPDHQIQCNKTAVRTTQHHHVEWRWDDDVNDPESLEAEELENAGRGRLTANGEFVRNMKLGDIVTVWARARFPAWQNNIEKVEVKVYWAVV